MKNKTQAQSARRPLLLLLAAAVILMAAIGGTLAYLNEKTAPVVNKFSVAGAPEPVVTEQVHGSVKEDVAVTVSGDSAAYVRAAVVISFLDDSGNVVGQAPVQGTDYTIEYNSANWQQGADGFWYYKGVVPAGTTTENLVDKCVNLNTGYVLSVTVLAQTVQPSPAQAAIDLWGMSYSNGAWTTAGGGEG